MGLFLFWCHRLICNVLSLCKHACKGVCDINPGIDPYPLLARLCNRLWPDFVTFTACKKSSFGLKRGEKVQCVSNRCKDLFERKKYFGVRCTLKLVLLGVEKISSHTHKTWSWHSVSLKGSFQSLWWAAPSFLYWNGRRPLLLHWVWQWLLPQIKTIFLKWPVHNDVRKLKIILSLIYITRPISI